MSALRVTNKFRFESSSEAAVQERQEGGAKIKERDKSLINDQ